MVACMEFIKSYVEGIYIYRAVERKHKRQEFLVGIDNEERKIKRVYPGREGREDAHVHP